MNFNTTVRSAFSQYASGGGRARRSEYWWFTLFAALVGLVGGLIDGLLGTQFIGVLVILALLAPSIALSVRRLHDTDRSGWTYLLILIPLVGPILMLVFFVTDGTDGTNRFGSSPKAFAV